MSMPEMGSTVESRALQAALEAYTRACIRYGLFSGGLARQALADARRYAQALATRSGDPEAWAAIVRLWDVTSSAEE